MTDLLWGLGAALDAIVSLVMLVTPRVSSPQYRYGVHVPEAYRSDPSLGAADRVFAGGVALGALASLPFLAAATLPALDGLAVAAPFVVIGGSFASYFAARHDILRAKSAGRWDAGGRPVTVAEIIPSRTDRTWPIWLVPATGIWVAFVVWGILLYPGLPASLPTHFGANGVPDAYSAKSVASAFFGSEIGGALLVVFAVLAAAITRARAPLDPNRPHGDAERQFQFRFQGVRALLGLVACLELTVGAASAQTWTVVPSTGVAQVYTVAPIVVGAVGVLVVMLRLGQLGSRLPLPPEPPGVRLTDAQLRRLHDDDALWLGGVLYYNREDSALLVPRRFGVGWTLNWGNPWSWVFLGAIVAIPFLVLASAVLG